MTQHRSAPRRRGKAKGSAEFGTVEETANRLGVSAALIYAGLNRGEVPGIRIGRAWRIHRSYGQPKEQARAE